MAITRVVSLVPSLTELVVWLGRGATLVGRTRFCTDPAAELNRVPIIGGTKNPRVDRIVAANPHLVIANREENRREDVEALRAAGLEVLVTDPNSVEQALEMVAALGQLLDAKGSADSLVADTREALATVRGHDPPRAFVPIWKEPWMGLGSETYGHDLLACAGIANVLEGRPRYPEVTLDAVAALRPDAVLLPDEPYPFKAADASLFAPIAPTRLVDGKLLWWYGPRMPVAIRTLGELVLEVMG